MNWQPPTEDEFDSEWITPLDAIGVSDERMADDHEKWELVEKLKAGQIIGVARTGQTRADLVGVQPFVPVHAGVWRHMGDSEEHYFWKTGHLVVPHVSATGTLTGGKERYFDIRFDPASFSGRPPPRVEDEAVARQTATAEQPASPDPLNDKRTNLTAPEAKRFCEFLLTELPEVTERDAHKRVSSFYHDRKVPRDWFWDIFRPIRGKKNPGRKPKARD